MAERKTIDGKSYEVIHQEKYYHVTRMKPPMSQGELIHSLAWHLKTEERIETNLREIENIEILQFEQDKIYFSADVKWFQFIESEEPTE